MTTTLPFSPHEIAALKKLAGMAAGTANGYQFIRVPDLVQIYWGVFKTDGIDGGTDDGGRADRAFDGYKTIWPVAFSDNKYALWTSNEPRKGPVVGIRAADSNGHLETITNPRDDRTGDEIATNYVDDVRVFKKTAEFGQFYAQRDNSYYKGEGREYYFDFLAFGRPA